MSKPTLGRGLGDLLGPERVSDRPAAPRQMDVGLRILIDGAPREPAPSEGPPVSNPPSPEGSPDRLLRALVIAVLASADVTLLGWTVHYAVTHQHALGWFGIAGCSLSALVAAACGCAAVVMSRND